MVCLVSFDSTSQGQLAMVIYEWNDAKYLGKEQSPDVADNNLPVSFSFSYPQVACRHYIT